MIKNISYITAFLLINFLVSCKKPDALTGSTNETAFISLTNVNTSAKVVNVYIDGKLANQYSSIGANASVLGTYVGASAGSHTIEVRDNTTNIVYGSTSINVEGSKTYSAFVYDVATSNTLKLLVLTTDRTTLPDLNSANVRFLNLSTGSPALDVWLIRRVGGVAKDSSMIYSSVPYIGSTTPDVNSLSAFKSVAASVPAGVNGSTAASDYIVRLKTAGTATIIATSASITLIPTKIYTIYARGTYPSITISTLLHN